MTIRKFRDILIITFLTFVVKGQDISPKLDSIHNLPGSNYEKLDDYHKILDEYLFKKKYSQLGSDAHQLAKWIHKEKHWEEAIKIVKIAYEAREKVTPIDNNLLKRSYYNYAIYNKRRENYSVAINFFEKVLKLKGNNLFKGRAAAIIGDSYEKIGDLYKSVEYQKKAFDYFDPSTQLKYIIANHTNIALTYKNIRNNESAKKGIFHLLKADSLLKSNNNSNSTDAYLVQINLGNLYYEGVGTKDVNKAIESFKKALDISKKLENDQYSSHVYYNLAVINITRNAELSTQYFKESFKKADPKSEIISKIHLGLGIKATTEKRYLEGQNHFKNAFSTHLNQEISDIYWLPSKKDLEKVKDKSFFLELLKRRLKGWNELAERDGNTSFSEQAIKTTTVGDQLIDFIIKENFSLRSKLFWRDLASEIYIMGLEACLLLKKNKEAFYFMEKNKAILLTQEITKKKSDIPKEILEREKKLENIITTLKNLFLEAQEHQKDSLLDIISSKEINLQYYRDSLSTKYTEYSSLISIPEIVNMEELNLRKDQVLIQYIMAERVAGVIPEAYGMIISGNTKEIFKIDKVDQLQKNIYQLRSILDKPFNTKEEIVKYHTLSYDIYNSLIPKRFQNVLLNKSITIIPDHVLNHIPFEALVTNLKKGSYLIEQAEINYTYSLSFAFQNTKINRNAEKDFLGVAPIEFSNNLTKLPKTKKELIEANRYYTGDLLLKEKATIQNFKKEAHNYKILHLATHADASDSLNPWVAFRYNKLTESELSVIKNQAELVILSACNTSLGEVRRGEGVMSLARGFFQSGAHTVIPSLWSTNDKATATITSNFYKNLSRGQTKSEALRKAKLHYLQNNKDAEASPHYWASLVLIGDTGVLMPQSNAQLFLWRAFFIILLILVIFVFFLRKKR